MWDKRANFRYVITRGTEGNNEIRDPNKQTPHPFISPPPPVYLGFENNGVKHFCCS